MYIANSTAKIKSKYFPVIGPVKLYCEQEINGSKDGVLQSEQLEVTIETPLAGVSDS